jgi:hypothetical protein
MPFVKGFSLFFWAIATWWIPMLVVLGIWRYLICRVPFAYDLEAAWAAAMLVLDDPGGEPFDRTLGAPMEVGCGREKDGKRC